MTPEQASYYAHTECVRLQRKWGWQPPAAEDREARWLRSLMGQHRGNWWGWRPHKGGPVAYAKGVPDTMTRAEVLAYVDA